MIALLPRTVTAEEPVTFNTAPSMRLTVTSVAPAWALTAVVLVSVQVTVSPVVGVVVGVQSALAILGSSDRMQMNPAPSAVESIKAFLSGMRRIFPPLHPAKQIPKQMFTASQKLCYLSIQNVKLY